jgi:hypothetical protein
VTSRTLVLAVAAAALVVGVVVAIERREPPRDPPASREAPDVESDARARPPEFPPASTAAELVAAWIRMIETRGDDDVSWAKSRLREMGELGRNLLRDAAAVMQQSNPAFVEQALQFLEESPRDEDLRFARESLASVNPQAVLRAAHLVAAIRVPAADVDATVLALGDAATRSAMPVRVAALRALASIGGDAAAEEALRVAAKTPAGERASAFTALSGFDHPRVRAALSAALGDTATPATTRIAAARSLIVLGDEQPVAWLREQLDAPPAEGVDLSDVVLEALAAARDEKALSRIGAVAGNPLEGVPARLAAVARLEPYPLEAKRGFLEAASRAAAGQDEVRIEALDARVRAGDLAAKEELATMLRKGDAAAAVVGSLVAGRTRDPGLAAPLADALGRSEFGPDVRAFVLRGLVLASNPASAQRVVLAMAADTGSPDAQESLAANAAFVLHDASPEMRRAMGPPILAAIGDPERRPRGAGLVHLLRAAAACCGADAARTVASYLTHEDPVVRRAAVDTLSFVADDQAEADLRAAWWRAPAGDERDAIERVLERAHFRLPQVAPGRRR